MNMKAFISYSSKDNARFVEKFADKIMDSGIGVWKDTLETIGDLTEIIEEIYNADIFIVIISKNSVESKWVAEEIKVAINRKIEEDLQIFPVVLAEDDVDVPIVLKHISKYIIYDSNSYDDKFNELIEDISKTSKKSLLGNLPLVYASLNNLSKQDCNIFKSLGSYLIFGRDEYYNEIYPIEIIQICDYDDEQIEYSLNILNDEGLIFDKGSQEGLGFNSQSFTSKGTYLYLKNFVPNFEKIIKNIIESISLDNCSLDEIVQDTQIDKNMIQCIVELFREMGFIKCDAYLNIYEVTSVGQNYFKKELEENNDKT